MTEIAENHATSIKKSLVSLHQIPSKPQLITLITETSHTSNPSLPALRPQHRAPHLLRGRDLALLRLLSEQRRREHVRRGQSVRRVNGRRRAGGLGAGRLPLFRDTMLETASETVHSGRGDITALDTVHNYGKHRVRDCTHGLTRGYVNRYITTDEITRHQPPVSPFSAC